MPETPTNYSPEPQTPSPGEPDSWFRFGTYNLLDLEMPRTPAQWARYELIVTVITEIYRGRAGALAVQEIIGDTRAEAGRVLRMLADDTGLQCNAVPARRSKPVAALASSQPRGRGSLRYHVGMLWTPEIQPVPGGMRAYDGGPDFWHAMLTLRLDAGGPVPVKWAAYHADPFRPRKRFHEAHRVLSAFQDERVPGAVGADWNNISADRRPNGRYYDEDPYTHQHHRKLRYQIKWNPDDPDAKTADRDSTEFLRREPGGLHDIAAVVDVPWTPSCGHWVDEHNRTDDFGLRRIDTIRATAELACVARAHTTHHSPHSEKASDHLPVSSDFALAEIEIAA
ncbi:hypothetical protein [Streptomyces sp. ME19-01-6]|uniref:hypothetical protein n=1 Tax=Streptomyces sp. ME19-01-6 TaxID=3028686 RepID=UPI0029B9382C|nr:hypothetical protein [Streptomyces sp. ME19-01-6]MDX3224492.1 hypothetical protein [Streptomyces sp. ME19-01-6]